MLAGLQLPPALNASTIAVFKKSTGEALRDLADRCGKYALKGGGQARTSDSYYIYRVIREGGIDLATPDNQDVIRNIFDAKPPFQLSQDSSFTAPSLGLTASSDYENRADSHPFVPFL
jgi:hypothetical protein